MKRVLPGLLVAGIALSGCSAPGGDGDGGFEAVSHIVYQRTGQHIQWNRGTRDDRAAQAAVAGLLGKDLTSASAVQIALLNNGELQATYEDLGVAQADVVQAGLLKNPVFSGAFEPAEGGEGIKIQMSVVEDFLDLFQIPLRKRMAAADYEIARLTVAGAAIDLAVRVREAFYRQQAAKELVELRAANAQAADAAMDLARRMHDAGNMNDLDFYNRQATCEQARLDMADAGADEAMQREELNMLLGLSGEEVGWKISEHLSPLPGEEREIEGIEKQAVESNLELAEATWRTRQMADKLGIKKELGPFSEAELGVSTEREFDDLWETGPAVSFPLPIFDFGQAGRDRARAEFIRQRQRCGAMEVMIQAKARQATALLLSARRRAESFSGTILPLRRKIMERTQLQYNGMLAGPFELLEAKQNEIEAQARGVTALRDYWLARTRVQSLIAGSGEARP